jgi:hypothetical protein
MIIFLGALIIYLGARGLCSEPPCAFFTLPDEILLSIFLAATPPWGLKCMIVCKKFFGLLMANQRQVPPEIFLNSILSSKELTLFYPELRILNDFYCGNPMPGFEADTRLMIEKYAAECLLVKLISLIREYSALPKFGLFIHILDFSLFRLSEPAFKTYFPQFLIILMENAKHRKNKYDLLDQGWDSIEQYIIPDPGLSNIRRKLLAILIKMSTSRGIRFVLNQVQVAVLITRIYRISSSL